MDIGIFIFLIAFFVTFSAKAQDYYHYITKDQEKALKSSTFLTRSYRDTGNGYRPYIDFAIDCGINGERGSLINDISNLGERVEGYPTVIKVLGKWDGKANLRHAELKKEYNLTIAIANSSETQVAKLRKVKPFLRRADKLSKAMAEAANVDYEGGCGAGPEDSQKVDFEITPKPKTAFYILDFEFDRCKAILNDPYDGSKCDLWRDIQPKGNELSGSYRYRVTWDDGMHSEGRFSALGTGRKIVRISK